MAKHLVRFVRVFEMGEMVAFAQESRLGMSRGKYRISIWKNVIFHTSLSLSIYTATAAALISDDSLLVNSREATFGKTT